MEKASTAAASEIERRAKQFIEGTTKCPHGGNLAKDCLRCLFELLWNCHGEGWNEGFTCANDSAKLGA